MGKLDVVLGEPMALSRTARTVTRSTWLSALRRARVASTSRLPRGRNFCRDRPSGYYIDFRMKADEPVWATSVVSVARISPFHGYFSVGSWLL